MQRFVFCLLILTPLFTCAQDLTGIWQGHFRSATGDKSSLFSFDDRYRFEVQIAQHDRKLDAVTYSYLSSVFYGKAAADGTINPATGKVMLQEGKLLEVKQQFGDVVCTMTCFLQYTKSGADEFLEGKYVSMNVRDSSNCGHGLVFLHKVASSDFYEEPFLIKREKELKKEELARSKPPASSGAKPSAPVKRPSATASARKPPPRNRDSTGLASATRRPAMRSGNHPEAAAPAALPPMARAAVPNRSDIRPGADSGLALSHKFPSITPRVLLDRSNQLVRALTVDTREVILNIYDDGAIDNDTVSVFLDNKMVIDHAMLTDRPLIVKIHLDEGNDYHELVMVADNEGEIPPNTSLMIVKAGDKEYKVNITSSLQKNATVTFKYVKPN
ncbi:MAG TPA: hypothetical protein VN616_12745 [Puia sp.]|nr:hypothetical protein [Puia sp.]